MTREIKSEGWAMYGRKGELRMETLRPTTCGTKERRREKNVFVSRVWVRTRVVLGVKEPNRAISRLLSILGHRYISRSAVCLRDLYKYDSDGCSGERGTDIAAADAASRVTSIVPVISSNMNLRCNNVYLIPPVPHAS